MSHQGVDPLSGPSLKPEAPRDASGPGLAAIVWNHRLRVLGGLICLVLLALCNGAMAYLTGPVVQVVLTGGKEGGGYVQTLVSWSGSLTRSLDDPLLLVAVMLVGLAIIKGVSNLGQSFLLGGVAERVGHGLRVRLYDHLMRVPLSIHRKHGLGDLLTRLLDDIQRVQDATILSPITIARESTSMLALLGVAIWMSPRLALAAAVALPVAALVIGLISKGVKRAAGRRQQHYGDLADRAAQGLAAIREVKSCSSEQREVVRFDGHGHRAMRWAVRRIVLRATGPLLNEVMASLALGLTLVYAGGQISSGALPPERFISFFAAVLLLYRPIKEIGHAINLAAGGRASVDRVAALLQEPKEPEGDSAELPDMTRALILEGVSFTYDQSERVIQDIDLELPVGKIVALSGPSGAGKTTVANIVCGLERPASGRLLWDELDLSSFSLRRLRARVALVPQQPLLLNATLAENLRYGAPDASERQLRSVIEAAGLTEVIASLDDDLETMVGPGGVGFSVGEAQRLALARAILRPAKLLVLDEPSSALDAGSEATMMRTLEEQRRTRAILLVAHSERVLSIADRIVHLEKGRVVDRG